MLEYPVEYPGRDTTDTDDTMLPFNDHSQKSRNHHHWLSWVLKEEVFYFLFFSLVNHFSLWCWVWLLCILDEKEVYDMSLSDEWLLLSCHGCFDDCLFFSSFFRDFNPSLSMLLFVVFLVIIYCHSLHFRHMSEIDMTRSPADVSLTVRYHEG